MTLLWVTRSAVSKILIDLSLFIKSPPRSSSSIGRGSSVHVVTSWAMIHEIHRVRLTALAVAKVDKLLLLCGLLSWMVRHILELTFLWPWICGCLSQEKPWGIQILWLQMRGLFFYLHSSSVKTEQCLSFLKPYVLASPHLSILLVQRLGFLQFDSRTMEFCTVIHIVFRTESSWY
jgi:hypothetical protein